MTDILPHDTIESVEQIVDRNRDPEIISRQPRFEDGESARNFLMSRFSWAIKSHLSAPAYNADTRARDTWLSNIWRSDPFLSGVLYSVIAIDKNRGWTILGGRNQVRRFSEILYSADGGEGWRSFLGQQALSFYSTDMGALTEAARRTASDNSALGAIYHLDSTRCRLTGNHDEPLEYYPTNASGFQKWRRTDFWRAASMISNEERMVRAGYSAVSRVLDMLTLAIGLVKHDQEQLGLAIPSGFLIANGMSEEAWNAKMEARQARRDNRGTEFANEVVVLFGESDAIDLKFVGLSNVPQHMTLDVFINTLMQLYALCFGYDPNEFWNVRTGALGIGALSLVQSEKATAKGELDFIQAWHDGFQNELPDSIDFEFDERGDGGEQLRAEAMDKVVGSVRSLYESGNAATENKEPLIDKSQALLLLAKAGIVPREWVEQLDESEASDIARARYNAQYKDRVIRAAERFPNEPIILKRHNRREVILYDTGAAMLHRKSYPVKPRELVFEDDNGKIDDVDIQGATTFAESVNSDFMDLIMANARKRRAG